MPPESANIHTTDTYCTAQIFRIAIKSNIIHSQEYNQIKMDVTE